MWRRDNLERPQLKLPTDVDAAPINRDIHDFAPRVVRSANGAAVLARSLIPERGHEMSEPRDDDPPHPNVSLAKLADKLSERPLPDIAEKILKLTYGEMLELTEMLSKITGDKWSPNPDAFAKLFHDWATSEVQK